MHVTWHFLTEKNLILVVIRVCNNPALAFKMHFACADSSKMTCFLVCRSVATADNQEGVLERNPRRTAVVYQGRFNNTVPFLKSVIQKCRRSNDKWRICKVERTRMGNFGVATGIHKCQRALRERSKDLGCQWFQGIPGQSGVHRQRGGWPGPRVRLPVEALWCRVHKYARRYVFPHFFNFQPHCFPSVADSCIQILNSFGRLYRKGCRPAAEGHRHHQNESRGPADHHVCLEPQRWRRTSVIRSLQWCSVFVTMPSLFHRPVIHGSATLPRYVSVLCVRRWAIVSSVPALRWHGPRGALQCHQLCTSDLHDRTYHRSPGESAAIVSQVLFFYISIGLVDVLFPCVETSLLSPQPGEFIHTLGDAHIYINHIEPLKEQVGQCKDGSCVSMHDTAMLTLILSIQLYSWHSLHLSPSAASAGDTPLPETEDPKESGENWRFPRRGFWNLWLQPSSCHQDADGCLMLKPCFFRFTN